MAAKCLEDIARDFCDDVTAYYASILHLGASDGIFWDPQLNAWIVTRYGSCRELLTSPNVARLRASFSSATDHHTLKELYASADRILALPTIAQDTEFGHSVRIRWKDYISQDQNIDPHSFEIIAENLLDSCAEDQEFDIYNSLLRPYIGFSIASRLQLDDAQWSEVWPAVADYVALFDGRLLTAEEVLNSVKAIISSYIYIFKSVNNTFNGPKTNDRLASAADYLLVLAAGQESTAYLLGTIFDQTSRAGVLSDVLADPASAMDLLIDEALRFDNPIQLIGRTAIQEFQIGTISVRAGDRIYLHIGAAHRDPSIYDSPHVFQTNRRRAPLLSFGVGDQRCIGIAHARRTAATFLSILGQKCSSVDVNSLRITRQATTAGREFKKLPATLSFRRATPLPV
jgi:hypothetical protein